jgi:Zn-dependent peptidase ImmA (M78 family)/DNA-binding XRE family transcriptional regulator
MLNERIRRARILKGFSLQDVADQLGDISKQALSKYEAGVDTPNSTRLLQLAGAFGVKPEYFFRRNLVTLDSVDFRKHSAFGKRQQEAVIEQVKEHLERYLAIEQLFDSEEVGNAPSALPKIPVGTAEDAEEAAHATRVAFGLGTNPIANLTEALEEKHLKVIPLATHAKFDGLCAQVNGGITVVIVSNKNRPGERQRFSMAHELGHIVMHFPEGMDSREEENLCHRFAGAFLFPKEKVFQHFGKHRNRLLVKELLLAKAEWGISAQAIMRRLKDQAVITDAFYSTACREWSMLGYRTQEPGALAAEPSYRMQQLGLRALAENLVTPSRAAELLKLSLADIEDIKANETEGGKLSSASSDL